jgi:hypothetical protein
VVIKSAPASREKRLWRSNSQPKEINLHVIGGRHEISGDKWRRITGFV